jgi:hypothetical protein
MMGIYRFKLDQNRTGLSLDHPLEDKVSKIKNETQKIKFAKGFGGITDMKVGPDRYQYILSVYAGADDCGPIYQPGKSMHLLHETYKRCNIQNSTKVRTYIRRLH